MLRDEVERLTLRVAELERQLKTNSRNSSKPPSQDVYAKPAPKSLRGKTGRGQGKQPGSAGASLKLVEDPGAVVDHIPSACSGCGAGLRNRPSVDVVRRQVHDLPEIVPVVTEHRLHRRRCRCGVLTTAAAPAEATAPACYGPNITALAAYLLTYQHIPIARAAELLAEAMSMAVSTGWVSSVLSRVAPQLEPFVDATQDALRRTPVAHFDETALRAGGARFWLHSASTDRLTTYLLHPKRGRGAIDAFDILPRFTGIAVHDGWHPYRTYDVTHALCNAHHQRELVAAADAHPEQDWPAQLRGVLDELNTAAHTARELGLDELPGEVLDPMTSRFDTHLATGLQLHTRNHTGHPQGGRPAQTKTRALLERLHRHRDDVLRFAFDLTVPFTNNQAERDIRMTKTQLKLAGWRTTPGATTWLTVRSYISTLRKNGIHVLTALRDAITGNPWLPTHPATT
ncbi:IS66 family transposase [Amycolatopsis sp. NBC_01480]|uniref:IS66 family transposase n=1 Tax=Amycolatopsis sp. NBC_01480 TaxID=2903562 RepID=UPI002E2B68C8|nr:IS66 family transposase [Amycolatopsis sp. NBC_01480]